VHVTRRGSGREAVQLVRAIIANHDDQARTAHNVAAETADRSELPERVRRLLDHRTDAVHARRVTYQHWCEALAEQARERQRWIDQHLSRTRDRGLDYGIDL
jgi:hypothetical protein